MDRFLIYLISLGGLLFLCFIFLAVWLRKYIFPRLKVNVPTTLELPTTIIKKPPGPIPHKREVGLALGAILIYLLIRFIGLPDFPIYFFADEAAPTVLAEGLVENNFKLGEEFLPTYFYNVDKYSLSLTVYLQLIPYLVLGKSVWITRGVSVLITLVGVISIGLILKQIFQTQYWWLGILVLSITPVWFLHSRTAFETSTATALYAGVLYVYTLYLYRSPRYIFLVIFMAALTFYSYNPARMVVLVTGVLLALVHFRFHLRNWKYVTSSLGLALLLAYPYLRFQYYHPLVEWQHLSMLSSYWTGDLQLSQKILRFGQEWLRGLNPWYWYSPHIQDLSRHVMKGYGHFLWLFFPFLVIGLWIAVKKWKTPAYQVLLVAIISTPTGGALVESSVTRSLVLVIPATLLTTIGLIRTIGFISNLKQQRQVAVLLFVILGTGNFVLLGDALKNGPLWFDDYGLYGLQYGGQQVFQTINEYLSEDPELRANVSPMWLNGQWLVTSFFVDEPHRVKAAIWMEWRKWVEWDNRYYQEIMCDPDTIGLATSNDWEYLKNTHPQRFQVLERILYPDGSTGFILFQPLDYEIQSDPACGKRFKSPDNLPWID